MICQECEKDPNLRCLRVLRTRKHFKFSTFHLMAESFLSGYQHTMTDGFDTTWKWKFKEGT
jgi:hypothetical protein